MSEDKIREAIENWKEGDLEYPHMTEQDWVSLVNHYWDAVDRVIQYIDSETEGTKLLYGVIDVLNEKQNQFERDQLTPQALAYIEKRADSELGGH